MVPAAIDEETPLAAASPKPWPKPLGKGKNAIFAILGFAIGLACGVALSGFHGGTSTSTNLDTDSTCNDLGGHAYVLNYYVPTSGIDCMAMEFAVPNGNQPGLCCSSALLSFEG